MILNIKKLINSANEPILSPWTHYIVDDILNYDFTMESEFIFNNSLFFQLLGELSHYKDKILNTFKPIRIVESPNGHKQEPAIKNTWARVNFLTENAYVDKEIHMDAVNKIWTCVIYCFPEKCNGTILIEGDPDKVISSKEIEWKQNRAIVFSPGTKNYPTWHKIINNTNKTRRAITLNIISEELTSKLPVTGYNKNQTLDETVF
jgi:hypothetical protein